MKNRGCQRCNSKRTAAILLLNEIQSGAVQYRKETKDSYANSDFSKLLSITLSQQTNYKIKKEREGTTSKEHQEIEKNAVAICQAQSENAD